MCLLRQATVADIYAIHDVRLSVRENVLGPGKVTVADIPPAITETGRGWVIDCDGEIVAFTIANKITGNIWALFVHPDHEGRGFGTRLHTVMLDWLWGEGCARSWLTTEPGTRAEGFYRHNGWRDAGHTDDGEILFERDRPPV